MEENIEDTLNNKNNHNIKNVNNQNTIGNIGSKEHAKEKENNINAMQQGVGMNKIMNDDKIRNDLEKFRKNGHFSKKNNWLNEDFSFQKIIKLKNHQL